MGNLSNLIHTQHYGLLLIIREKLKICKNIEEKFIFNTLILSSWTNDGQNIVFSYQGYK